jgi:hypothetical protein
MPLTLSLAPFPAPTSCLPMTRWLMKQGLGTDGPLAQELSSGPVCASPSWKAVPNRCPGLEARWCETHFVRSPTRPAWARVHTPSSWEGTGSGAWCQLYPGVHGGTRSPRPLQDVICKHLQHDRPCLWAWKWP